MAYQIGIGALWFLTSSILSTWANTTFLKTFADPLLHTLVRFVGSALIGSASQIVTKESKPNEIVTVAIKCIVPALLLWIANFSNSVSLQLAGITLTYVVKACIPVFTVLICALGGQKFPVLIYVSLLPICLGVGLASASDLDFSFVGLCAALTSAIAQTLMNISIKRVRTSTGYSGSKAFMGMTMVCSLLTISVLVGQVVLSSVSGTSAGNDLPYSIVVLKEAVAQLTQGNQWPLALIFLSALAYHLEYALNFIFVGFVSSVTFSVSDIARRIAIIVTGAVVFQKSLTAQNWVGISVALGGVLWYSYLENKEAQKTAIEKKK